MPSPYPPQPSMLRCQVCGGAPAMRVRARSIVGLVISMRERDVEALLCRMCGIATVRSLQARTVVTGWWGALSFFMNFAAVIQNAEMLRHLRRWQAPHPASIAARPLDPGRSVFARPSAWPGMVMAIVFLLVLIVASFET